MRMKKIGAVAALVTALALSGCASTDTSVSGGGNGGASGDGAGAGKTLDVFMSVNTQFPDEQRTWFDQMSAKFKEQTGATVKFETFASPSEELTKIQTSVIAGQGPDVYGLGTTFTPTAYGTDAFLKLDDAAWEKIGGKDKFIDGTLGISGPDEQNQIGIPFVSRPFVMAYNKDLLAQAGIDAPATSWDELTAQAKTLTKDGVYGLAIAYKDNFDPWKYIWGMSNQAGTDIVDGRSANLNTEPVKKAYETYFNWVSKDKVVDPASLGWSNTQALAAFAEGKAAYMLMTSAISLPSLQNSAVKDSFEYALMPTIAPGETENKATPKKAASILSGDNLVIAKYSKNQDLALQFVKMITDPDVQADYYKTFGQFPVNKEAASALTGDDKILEPIIAAAQESKATPFTGAWGDIQIELTNVVVQSIPELSRGGVSSDALNQRLADAQSKAQAVLDRAK